MSRGYQNIKNTANPAGILSREKLLLLKKEYARMPKGSLHIKSCRGYHYFYHYIDSVQKPLNLDKDSGLIYKLSRKKYLFRVLNNDWDSVSKQLRIFEKAGLNLQRITLSFSQYRWVSSEYQSNTGWQENLKYSTASGIAMRSKSERDIASRLEHYGVPYRYEMKIKVDVSALVDGLEEYLERNCRPDNYTHKMFSYRDGGCVWHVPENLQWMNAPGSIWRSFDYRTNTVTLSVDFAILLGDGSILIWEHAGLCLNPVYRCNASERIFVLRASDYAKADNIIFTTESDVLDLADIDRIITDRILPRL